MRSNQYHSFQALAEHLVGESVVAVNFQFFRKPPGGLPTPPHQVACFNSVSDGIKEDLPYFFVFFFMVVLLNPISLQIEIEINKHKIQDGFYFMLEPPGKAITLWLALDKVFCCFRQGCFFVALDNFVCSRQGFLLLLL